MRNINSFPSLRLIKSLPKFYQHVRSVSRDAGASQKNLINNQLNRSFKQYELIMKELIIKKKKESYQDFLLEELLNECGIHDSLFSLHGSLLEKEYIITMDIRKLEKIGLLSNSAVAPVMEKLLSCVEPFPFSINESTAELRNTEEFPQSERITIKKIRDLIEIKYLAWKFKVDVNFIKLILKRLRLSLYSGRSLRNLKRNLDSLNAFPQTSNKSIPSKIYLINLRPFEIETLRNFQDNFFGLEWDNAVQLFPYLMRKPYALIMLFVETLQDVGFTHIQIQQALPFLRGDLKFLFHRLNYLQSNSELCNFKCDNDFLKLLFFNPKTLSYLVEKQHKTLKELLCLIQEREKKCFRRFCKEELYYQLNKKFHLNKDQLKVLQRHPKLLYVPETQVNDTINFLRIMNFEDEEIIESIAIVLYPRENIKKALAQLVEEEETLCKFGFHNGAVPEETDFFQMGTKLKSKTLQLCLYYMEKKHNFSGNGTLILED